VGGEALPPLRSAQISFVGPIAGEATATARVLRRGRNATWIAAELACAGSVCLDATFVFMGPVESRLRYVRPRVLPGLIPPEQAAMREPPPGPLHFLEHFEVRYALQPDPDPKPDFTWWMRAKGHAQIDPALHLLLCADLPPPGVLPLMPRPVPPISSMTWLANFLAPRPATDDGWWLIRTVGDYAENGCSSDTSEIWNTDGAPMMRAMQSVALFG
jgi:hypothetical protein